MAKTYSWDIGNDTYGYIVNPNNTNDAYVGEELFGDSLQIVIDWTKNCSQSAYEDRFAKLQQKCIDNNYDVKFENVAAYANINTTCDNLKGKDGRGIKGINELGDDQTGSYMQIQFEYDNGEVSNIIKIPKGKDGLKGDKGADPDDPVSSIYISIYKSGVDGDNIIEDIDKPLGGTYDFVRNQFNETQLNNDGWFTSASEGYKSLKNPIWMSCYTFVSSSNAPADWSIPVQITGDDGKPGTDGITTEFIYYQSKSEPDVSQIAKKYIKIEENPNDSENTKKYKLDDKITIEILSSNPPKKNDLEYKYVGLEVSKGQYEYYIWSEYMPDYIPVGWNDSPEGVDEENPIEWFTTRKIDKKTKKWSEFKEPVAIWSKYGEKGEDGDGVEYIYLLTNTATPPTNPTPKDYKDINTEIGQSYQNKDTEWLPPTEVKYTTIDDINIKYVDTSWLDDPQPVSQDNLYCWVACRKFRKDEETKTKIWGAYSKPSLWAKYGETGKSGTCIRKLYYLSTDTSNPPSLPVDSLVTGSWTTAFPVNYKYGENVVWGTEAELYVTTNEFVEKYEIISTIKTIDGETVVVPPEDAIVKVNTKLITSAIPSTEQIDYKYLVLKQNDNTIYYKWNTTENRYKELSERPKDSLYKEELNTKIVNKLPTKKDDDETIEFLKYNGDYYFWDPTENKYTKSDLRTEEVDDIITYFPPEGVREINTIETSTFPTENYINYKYVLYKKQYYNWIVTSWCAPFIVTGLKGDAGEPVAYTTFIFAYYKTYETDKDGNAIGKPSVPVQLNVNDGEYTSDIDGVSLYWKDFPIATIDKSDNFAPGVLRVDGQVINGETFRWYQLAGSVDRNGDIKWGTPEYANGLDGKDGVMTEFRYAVTHNEKAPQLTPTVRNPEYKINGVSYGWYTTSAEFASLTVPKGGAMWQIWGKIDVKTDNLIGSWYGPTRISGEQGEPGLVGPTGLRGVSGLHGVNMIPRYCLGTYNEDDAERNGKFGAEKVINDEKVTLEGYFGDEVPDTAATTTIKGWFSKQPPETNTIKTNIDLIGEAYINQVKNENNTEGSGYYQEKYNGRVIRNKRTSEIPNKGSKYQKTEYDYYLIKIDENGFDLETIKTNTTEENLGIFVWCVQGEEQDSYIRTKDYREISIKDAPINAVVINVLENQTSIPNEENALYKYILYNGYYYQWDGSEYRVLTSNKPSDAILESDINTKIVSELPSSKIKTYVKYNGYFYKWNGDRYVAFVDNVTQNPTTPPDAICENVSTVTTIPENEEINYLYLRKSFDTYYKYYAWVDVPQNELDVPDSKYKQKIVDWGTPFRLQGANGLNFAGNRGQVVYPAGLYNPHEIYKCDDKKAPYVMDPNDQQFYVLDRVMDWVGIIPEDYEGNKEKYDYKYEGITDQSGDSPSKNYSNATNDLGVTPAWVKFESFKAIYASVGIIANGMIGSAVFNNEFMFSQQGKAYPYRTENGIGRFDTTQPRTESTHYEAFLSGYDFDDDKKVWTINGEVVSDTSVDPYNESNIFHPNVCINFKTGQMWLNGGATRFGAFAIEENDSNTASNIMPYEKIQEWGSDFILSPSERANLKDEYQKFLLNYSDTIEKYKIFFLNDTVTNKELTDAFKKAREAYEKHITPTAKICSVLPSSEEDVYYRYVKLYNDTDNLYGKIYVWRVDVKKYEEDVNIEENDILESDIIYINTTKDTFDFNVKQKYSYVKHNDLFYEISASTSNSLYRYDEVKGIEKVNTYDELSKKDNNIYILLNDSLDIKNNILEHKGYYQVTDGIVKKISNIEGITVNVVKGIPTEVNSTSPDYVILSNNKTSTLNNGIGLLYRRENYEGEIYVPINPLLVDKKIMFSRDDNMHISVSYDDISKFYQENEKLIIKINEKINENINLEKQRLDNISDDNVIADTEIQDLINEKNRIIIESGSTYDNADDYYNNELGISSADLSAYTQAAANAVTALEYHICGATDHYTTATTGFDIKGLSSTDNTDDYGWINKFYEEKANLEHSIKRAQQLYTKGGLDRMNAMAADKQISDLEIPMLKEELARINSEYPQFIDSVSGISGVTTGISSSTIDYKNSYTKAVNALNHHINGATNHYTTATTGFDIVTATGETCYYNIQNYYSKKANLQKNISIVGEYLNQESTNRLNAMADDNKISDLEIPMLNEELDLLTSASASTYSAATKAEVSKASIEEYSKAAASAKTALEHHINGATNHYTTATTGFDIVTATGATCYYNIQDYYNKKAELDYKITEAQRNYAESGITRLNALANDNVITREEVRSLVDEKNRIESESANTSSNGLSLSGFDITITGSVSTYTSTTQNAVNVLTNYIKNTTSDTNSLSGTRIIFGTGDTLLGYGWIAKYYKDKAALEEKITNVQKAYAQGGLARIAQLGSDNIVSITEIETLRNEKKRIESESANTLDSAKVYYGVIYNENNHDEVKSAATAYTSTTQNAIKALNHHISAATKHYTTSTTSTTGFPIETSNAAIKFSNIADYYTKKSALECAIKQAEKAYAQIGVTQNSTYQNLFNAFSGKIDTFNGAILTNHIGIADQNSSGGIGNITTVLNTLNEPNYKYKGDRIVFAAGIPSCTDDNIRFHKYISLDEVEKFIPTNIDEKLMFKYDNIDDIFIPEGMYYNGCTLDIGTNGSNYKDELKFQNGSAVTYVYYKTLVGNNRRVKHWAKKGEYKKIGESGNNQGYDLIKDTIFDQNTLLYDTIINKKITKVSRAKSLGSGYKLYEWVDSNEYEYNDLKSINIISGTTYYITEITDYFKYNIVDTSGNCYYKTEENVLNNGKTEENEDNIKYFSKYKLASTIITDKGELINKKLTTGEIEINDDISSEESVGSFSLVNEDINITITKDDIDTEKAKITSNVKVITRKEINSNGDDGGRLYFPGGSSYRNGNKPTIYTLKSGKEDSNTKKIILATLYDCPAASRIHTGNTTSYVVVPSITISGSIRRYHRGYYTPVGQLYLKYKIKDDDKEIETIKVIARQDDTNWVEQNWSYLTLAYPGGAVSLENFSGGKIELCCSYCIMLPTYGNWLQHDEAYFNLSTTVNSKNYTFTIKNSKGEDEVHSGSTNTLLYDVAPSGNFAQIGKNGFYFKFGETTLTMSQNGLKLNGKPLTT